MKGVKLVLVLGLVMLLAAAFTLPGCAPAAPKGAVKIGVLGPMATDVGKAMKLTSELAAKEINEAGGILGRPVEVYFGETEYKATKATSEVHRLVEAEGCEFIAGAYSSEASLSAREACMDLKVICVIGGGATHDHIVKVVENYDRYKYFFRCCPPDEIDCEAVYVCEEQVPFMAEVIKKKLGIEKVKVGILCDATAWQDVAYPYFIEHMEKAGYEVVYKSRFDPAATDCTPYLIPIKESGAHIVIGGACYKSSIPLVKQWTDLEVPCIWAGAHCYSWTPMWEEMVGGKGQYHTTYQLGAGPIAITPDTKRIWDYLYDEIGFCQYNSHGPYVAIWSIKHAADKAGTLEKEAMVKALEEIKFDSVGGTFDYDNKTHSHIWGPVGTGAPIWTIQHLPGERIEAVHPPELATGELELPPWMLKAYGK